MKVRGTEESGIYVQRGEHANYFSVKVENDDRCRGGFTTKYVWKLVVDPTRSITTKQARYRASEDWFARGTHAQKRAHEIEEELEQASLVDIKRKLEATELFSEVEDVGNLMYDCTVLGDAHEAADAVYAQLPFLEVELFEGGRILTAYLKGT